MLRAAAQQAEDLLAERQIIALGPGAAEAFAEALQRPGEVNEQLAEALQRSRQFSWVD